MNAPADGPTDVRYWNCDVCHTPVREEGRWRHADCTPPEIPPGAVAAIAKLKEH